MGDRNRAWEFADFIDRTFPHAERIADVAGGHGELSYWLQELGHRPVVIEPRDVRLPRAIHRDLRKRAVWEGRVPTIERIVAPVETVDLHDFSLVVGLHPDQATEPAVRAALAYDLDFAVVPCCVFPMDGGTYTAHGWVEYLATLAPGTRIARLPISGANAVVWRRRSTPSTGGRVVSR